MPFYKLILFSSGHDSPKRYMKNADQRFNYFEGIVQQFIQVQAMQLSCWKKLAIEYSSVAMTPCRCHAMMRLKLS